MVKLTQARQAAGTEAILTRPLSVVVEVEPLGEALPSVVQAAELGEFELEDNSSGPEKTSSLLLLEKVCWNGFELSIVGWYQRWELLEGSE